MLEQLTIGDLMRIIAWAFFGGLPLVLSFGMGDMTNNPDGSVPIGLLFWACFAAQIAFGVAAYMAGVKS